MAMYAQRNLVELNIDATDLIQGKVKAKTVGKPILPFYFGGTSHYGLCGIWTGINVIPYTLYDKIKDELELADYVPTDMTIILADKTLRVPRNR